MDIGVDQRVIQAEAMDAAIIAAVLDAIVVIDHKGIIQRFNVAAQRMFGFSEEETLGQNVSVLMPDDIAHEHDSYLSNYMDSRVPHIVGRERQVIGRTKDGHEFPALLAVSEANIDGRPVFIGNIRDLSRQRDAERALANSEEKFRSAIAAVASPLLIMHRSSAIIRYANESAARELTALLGPEIVGQSGREIFEDMDNRHKFFQTLEKERGRIRNLVLLSRLKDCGSLRWLNISTEPMNFDGQRCVMVTWTDISDFKRAELELLRSKEEAESASRAKSHFLANMSHELRTPLNAILGFTEILVLEMFGPLGTDKYSEYAGDIKSSAQHLLSLINDLLDLSKVEAGKYRLELTEIDPARLVETGTRLVSAVAARKGIDMQINLADNLPTITADDRALRQVLLNLLSNAIKFTDPEGSVNVCVEPCDNGQCVVFRVNDTGIGIAREDLDLVLIPFEQSKNAMVRENEEGAGLGLALSKHLVEMHGGTLKIDSAKGVGTSVYVTIPLAPPEDAENDQPKG